MYSSFKIKRRYIFCKCSNPDKKEIQNFLLSFFGEYNYGKLALKFIEIRDTSFILSCNRKYLLPILGALSLLNKPRVIPLHVSGTLKALKSKVDKL